MKIRCGYISNSSSAAFIVYNWFDLSLEIRMYIMSYDVNALEVWRKKNIKYEIEEDGYSQDCPFYGREFSFDRKNNKGKEKYDFGWLNNCCGWSFKEDKKRNTCTISTSMDNFHMKEWLKYNKVDFDELNPYHF